MSTRCRIAYCFDEKSSIPSSYCHYDGYIEGVGLALLDKYNDKHNAFYLASAGDFRSLIHSKMNDEGYYETRTVEELEHFSDFHLPAIHDDFDALIKNFEDSDQEFLYVYFEKADCWKVFANKWDKVKQDFFVEYLGDLEHCVKNLKA